MHKRYFSTAVERHKIYLLKSSGESKPWTKDKIFLNYRFCNVYRELDKVTVWIREKIREPFADHPKLWFMLCIARQFNWPETLQEIMDEGCWPIRKWDEEKAFQILKARQDRGEKIYTGAYMIRGPVQETDGFVNKAEHTCKNVLSPLYKERPPFSSLQNTHSWLCGFHGWGGFLSYEVVTDLRHTRYLMNAPDIMTWANAGPGALRGLNRLAGRHLNSKCKDTNQEMLKLLGKSSTELPSYMPAWEMREVEHWLCEFDKYERVRLGEGRPRSKYKGA